MTEFPRIPPELDRRRKVTKEDEEKILTMHHEGDTYKFIASVFHLSETTVYYLVKKYTEPDIYQRRQDAKKINQGTYVKRHGIHHKGGDTRKYRLSTTAGEAVMEYDRKRNLARYHRLKETINPRRNKQRRDLRIAKNNKIDI